MNEASEIAAQRLAQALAFVSTWNATRSYATACHAAPYQELSVGAGPYRSGLSNLFFL